jgi:hypothetical protein
VKAAIWGSGGWSAASHSVFMLRAAGRAQARRSGFVCSIGCPRGSAAIACACASTSILPATLSLSGALTGDWRLLSRMHPNCACLASLTSSFGVVARDAIADRKNKVTTPGPRQIALPAVDARQHRNCTRVRPKFFLPKNAFQMSLISNEPPV